MLVLSFKIQPVDDCDAMIGADLVAAYNDLFHLGKCSMHRWDQNISDSLPSDWICTVILV